MGESTANLSVGQVRIILEALEWAVQVPEGIETPPNLIVTDPHSNTELGSIVLNQFGYYEWTPNTVLTESN